MTTSTHHIILALAAIVAAAFFSSCAGSFSEKDRTIIYGNIDNSDGSRGLLHLFTVENAGENEVLREKSVDMPKRAIRSDEYRLLAQRMVETVSDTTVGGVGIAGPQVGINKRVVAVQRFDKEGEPFEVYPNIHIISYSPETQCGFEGCLSVPDRREEVDRSQTVVISYMDPSSRSCHVVIDTVSGFTAVIFQHEVDHLEGIIYTDRVK